MRLYVAYAATDGGADALALGVRLARTFGAGLDIGMVVPPDRSSALTAGNFEDMLVTQADTWLATARASVPAEIDVATHIVVHDSTPEAVLSDAERTGASVIIVGGTGGGLVGALSLGSVVNDLVHSAPLPVVIAPRGLRRSKVTEVTSLTCAFGERPGAKEVLGTSIRAAALAKIPLRIVSLIALDSLAKGSDGLDAAREHARAGFTKAVEALASDAEVTYEVVDGDTVEDAINKMDWVDGDLLIVGSSRLAAPRRLFLGSTAAKMMRVVAVPMMIVPREDS